MLDLLRWRVASRAIFILIAFTQHFEKFAIVNLFPALEPFLKKVKNISKLWYRNEINFANCSRQSNLLIPQNGEKIEKRMSKSRRNVKITMWIFHTCTDICCAQPLGSRFSFPSPFIVVHMNYQLLDFITLCSSFTAELFPKCTAISLSRELRNDS
jgi:hypothetical protein